MRKNFLFLLLFCFWAYGPVYATTPSKVYVIQIDDKIISPVIQEYIESAIKKSEKEGAECLILELDTPGGLLPTTRLIVKDIMNAQVPIITYISPSGSRAGSAGVFITLASSKKWMELTFKSLIWSR